MDREEASRLYDSGKEAVIEKLLSFSDHIKNLEQSIAALTRNSTNSSRPPSSDPPGLKKRKTKPKSKRRQGGQPGHEGKNRKLEPAEEMDAIHDLYPEQCEHCGRFLSHTLIDPALQPMRHQVFDIPEIAPFKEEYRCHTLLCQCGHSTTAQLPQQVALSNFGPRTHAAIAYLTATHRVTRRGIAEIMKSLFGLTISTGAICNAANRVADACCPVTIAIKRYITSSLTLNIDETGWKCKGERRYLWTFVAPKAVLFHISPSRAGKVLREVLGETFKGVIVSDDHSAYASYQKNGLRQLCWAHIIRKLKGLKEDRSSPNAYCFAKYMLKNIGAIFKIWHAFQIKPGSRKKLWDDTEPMRSQMHALCFVFDSCKDKRVKTRTKRLLDNWQHLFTFLQHDQVEPTNNSAERAIRPAVQWRKICFGSQSETGELFTERMLSVVGTCRLHHINPLEFLAKQVHAYLAGDQDSRSFPLSLPS
jgi:transposase